jgi:hypothetical protein
MTFGKVITNDGKTLKIEGYRGATTTVHTNAGTRVFVLIGIHVSDVAIGSILVVYGNKGADGSITASVLVGG